VDIVVGAESFLVAVVSATKKSKASAAFPLKMASDLGS
jgi:hypothetical protein